jgi:alpha-tubulin suppressor-like RCC1 family protein
MMPPRASLALLSWVLCASLDLARANGWPVARFKNGTVGVQNEGGNVMVNSNELYVVGDLLVEGTLSVGASRLIPPKCMPPGGDKLQHNGTHWFCVCVENWSGKTCETPPSPPPMPPPPTSPPPPYIVPETSMVSVGEGHTCAILDDKSVKCWGSNSSGQLGLGDKNNRGDNSGEMGDNLPAVDLGTGRVATVVSARGYFHTCALLDDTSVKCWGSREGENNQGALGLGDRETRGDESGEMGDNLPAVNLGTGRVATVIFSGSYHNCAILDDTSLKCWGWNYYGQLGLGHTNIRGRNSWDMGDNLPAVEI